MSTINLAFIDREAERRFARLIVGQREEVGGILFFDYGRIENLHWAKHQRLFGMKSIGLIRHWLVCPNTSNLRGREYAVSDFDQLLGIAEQTADALGCAFLHFHSHPNGSLAPSSADLRFWEKYFAAGGGKGRGVVATEDSWCANGFKLACQQVEGENKYSAGRFLAWDYIRHVIRNDSRRNRP